MKVEYVPPPRDIQITMRDSQAIVLMRFLLDRESSLIYPLGDLLGMLRNLLGR